MFHPLLLLLLHLKLQWGAGWVGECVGGVGGWVCLVKPLFSI